MDEAQAQTQSSKGAPVPKAGRGVITMAFGDDYVRMAIHLARSIRVQSPDLPIVLVTDSPNVGLDNHFFDVVPLDPSLASGLSHKLHLDTYSPFEETLFLDADITAVRPLEPLFEAFSGSSFSTQGSRSDQEEVLGVNVALVRDELGVEDVISLNGGLYYFRHDSKAAEAFITARGLLERYEELGIRPIYGQPNEEPLMSLAMSITGQSFLPIEDAWMTTTVVPLEDFRIDVLRHSCSFREDGLVKHPTVIHWTRHHMRRYYYRRENLKLILNERLPLPGSVISNLVNAVMNPVQAVGIFVYRVLKAITGRAPFKWRPVLPMKRYV